MGTQFQPLQTSQSAWIHFASGVQRTEKTTSGKHKILTFKWLEKRGIWHLKLRYSTNNKSFCCSLFREKNTKCCYFWARTVPWTNIMAYHCYQPWKGKNSFAAPARIFAVRGRNNAGRGRKKTRIISCICTTHKIHPNLFFFHSCIAGAFFFWYIQLLYKCTKAKGLFL